MDKVFSFHNGWFKLTAGFDTIFETKQKEEKHLSEQAKKPKGVAENYPDKDEGDWWFLETNMKKTMRACVCACPTVAVYLTSNSIMMDR